ncbi:MAG: response regulator transcription factor [Bacteroidales bacterium]|nr:response regulator transcription factor [Bacteroidales bacterium]
METKVNIIALDDHQIVLDGIEYSLSKSNKFNLVAVANSSNEFFLKLSQLNKHIEIAIVDLNLNDGSSDIMETCRKVKKQYPQIKILVLTTYTGKQLMAKLRDEKIDGYLSKTHSREELFTALEVLSRGETFFQQTNKQEAVKELDDDFSLQISLSEREKEILTNIVAGLTDKQIADRLIISDKTVKTHRQNLRNKFKVSSTAQLIREAIERGVVCC